MKFAHFFIGRPVFAGVLSLLLVVVGALSLLRLPVSEYPEVVPPSVVVRANYPGANARTIAATVAAPLEQAINGVEHALYMFSQAASDGSLQVTVTFQLGTDPDLAQIQVQNRVAQALPKLPEDVRRLGVTTLKQSPDLTLVAHLICTNGRYDELYLRNFAALQVKDELARIRGVGNAEIFGTGEFAMRVWLDPRKLNARGLTPGDVLAAIREQNTQVAAGALGQQPSAGSNAFEMQISTQGRLVDEEEFSRIVIKVGANGQKTRLGDVARIELGSATYALRSLLDNQVAVAIPIFMAPGANALQLSADVRAKLDELQTSFPEGIEYRVVYDPTVFVRESIEKVVITLLEAILLVVIVVVVFLQTWRASIIPLAAVPVSLIGTFAAMSAFGFSINALSLFGLVLAIGIVVDDAIVVVENVERNIREGLGPVEATKKAMGEVTGPIIATALVLCAVFVPTAFISGLTGQFYKQFAITIAISTVISAFNSLTLSPALSAALLRDHRAPRDRITRGLDFLFGWFFRGFQHAFDWAGARYSTLVRAVLRRGAFALLVYAALVGLTGYAFDKVPTGFVPSQDKQYLVAFAQLPEAASLERTERVIREMSRIALEHPGVEHAVAFPGLSINGFSIASNAGVIFVGLKPFTQRRTPELSGPAIAGDLSGKYAGIAEAFALAVTPPPVLGLGALGGFKLYVEDRADLGFDSLFAATQGLVGRAWQDPTLNNVFSTFTVNVPQVGIDVDRVKAKTLGVPLLGLFETLQVNLGSIYVNDFNRFGRTFQVIVQAESEYRQEPRDVTNLEVATANGDMVPLGALVRVEEGHGPDRVMRYNGYPAAEITGAPAPGASSGEAEAAIAALADATLAKGLAFEWTELTYQRILAGNTAVFVFPLCLLLIFLVLAAQYESFRLPLAIVLIVPLCLLFALTGVWLTKGDNNIFTQIGLIVLVGLACKNAILIVEFAKVKQDEGLPPREAAVAAARLRLRPILMTSIAFIAGVWPLVASTGAGAEMRRAMGIAVFAGMIGVTLLGLVLTPVFYALLMGGLRAPRPAEPAAPPPPASPPAASLATGLGVLLLAILPAGCLLAPVGPDYARPGLEIPAEFAGAARDAWKEGEPKDALPRGAWWRIFGDQELDQLQELARISSQELLAAAARYEQSLAASGIAKSNLLPVVSADPAVTRERYSANAVLPMPVTHATTLSLPLQASYEIDLFGKVRRSVEANLRDAEAATITLETVRLALHAEVARLYFTIRALDSELDTLRRTSQLRGEAVTLIRSQVNAGFGIELDLARAEAEAASTVAELRVAERRRIELVHALAVLLGRPATNFEVPERQVSPAEPPRVPAGLPADLLERRPDVAAAERSLAASNARIGVVKASFFPSISLTGSAGFESQDLNSLFDWSSRVWSIAPSISVPIFQGGRNSAALARARAVWDENVAAYRQQLLIAFQEVQDALDASRLLAGEAAARLTAHEAAARAARLSRARFAAGLVSYLEVVDAERTALALERARMQLHGQRYVVTVQLIRALGGGWELRSAQLPKLSGG